MLKEFRDYSKNIDENCDVCVIGSGAGGAVAAKEIAEAGYSVVLVEEGGYFTKEHFTGKPLQSMQDMWRDGGATMTFGVPAVMLPLGKCIGGTTAINAGTCFRTPDHVLLKWQKEFGLDHLTKQNLDDIFQRVEKEISVTDLSWDILGNCVKIVKRGADKLGLNCKPLKHNVIDCKGCGTCLTGCIEGAKQSTDVSYIPRAIKFGARVYADCMAEKLIIKNGIVCGVHCKLTDRKTKQHTYSMTIKAKKVIVACGATQTPMFLKKNKLKNKNIGRHLQIHPATRVCALMAEKVEGWKGPMQGAYIDDYKDEGILLEGAFLHPSILLSAFPFIGRHFKELASEFPNIASFGLMVKDNTTGRVLNLSKKSMTATYFLQKQDARALQKGIAYTARIFFAAGAKKVFTPLYKMPVLNTISDVDTFLSLRVKRSDIAEAMAFHPLGTCRMAATPKNGVIDKSGETFEVRNLYVADASAIPSSLGVNPQVTIMTLSTLISRGIIDSLNSGK